jgi:hypothetical protein
MRQGNVRAHGAALTVTVSVSVYPVLATSTLEPV